MLSLKEIEEGGSKYCSRRLHYRKVRGKLRLEDWKLSY